jgi:hypothetical protein
MSHVAGPWKWRYGAGHIQQQQIYVEATDRVVATVADQNEANADLITSAPDLLEALEELVALSDAYTDDRYARARVAIAKAKGEQS